MIKEKFKKHLELGRQYLDRAMSLDLEQYPETRESYDRLMRVFSSEVDKAEALFEVMEAK